MSAGRLPAHVSNLAAALALMCTVAHAQEKSRPPEPVALPEVAVTASATRDSVEKSYRRMLRGMEFFDKSRATAPTASLRFKLLPRKRDTSMENIQLEILGDTVAYTVPVAADNTFALERHADALNENAVVTPNRRSRSMTWRADIRTPGLPPNTRRLGDLRLECQVGFEADLISNVRNRIASLFAGMTDYCGSIDPQYLFFSDRPLFSVTLVNGARREVLPVDRMYAGASADPELPSLLQYCDCEVLLARTYYLPLGDRSWPDDTRVEFEYMDDRQ